MSMIMLDPEDFQQMPEDRAMEACKRYQAAAEKLLTSRYRDGECDAVALHVFEGECEEIAEFLKKGED